MFKIKKPPVEPQKSHFANTPKEVHKIEWYNLNPGSTINYSNKFIDLASRFPDGIVSLELDYGGCCYEGDRPNISVIVRQEQYAADLYNEAVKEYEVKLLEYKEWYKTNEKKIDAELKRRKEYAKELEKLNKKFK